MDVVASVLIFAAYVLTLIALQRLGLLFRCEVRLKGPFIVVGFKPTEGKLKCFGTPNNPVHFVTIVSFSVLVYLIYSVIANPGMLDVGRIKPFDAHIYILSYLIAVNVHEIGHVVASECEGGKVHSVNCFFCCSSQSTDTRKLRFLWTGKRE